MYEPATATIQTFRTRKGAENAAAKHGEVTWDKTRTVEVDGRRSLVIEGRFTTFLTVVPRYDREQGREVFDVNSVHLRVISQVVDGVVVYEDPARKAALASA